MKKIFTFLLPALLISCATPGTPDSGSGQPDPNLILVAGGTFTMEDTYGPPKGKNPHKVSLDSFYIGKYETTQKEYEQIMGKNPSTNKGLNSPVETVNWFDAVTYCNEKSKKEGLKVAYDLNNGNLLDTEGNPTTDLTKVVGYRLPTEAEWEFAARGGTKTQGFRFAGGDNIDLLAWYNTDRAREVGGKKPNELGLYDLNGNVEEWVSDWFSPYPVTEVRNPIQNNIGEVGNILAKVHRGGGVTERTFELSRRGNSDQKHKSYVLGFRIAKSK